MRFKMMTRTAIGVLVLALFHSTVCAQDMKLTLELHPEGAILRLHLIHAKDEQALTFVIAPGARVLDWVKAVVKAAHPP